jgi:O-antigen/teichoic acid export membrane protein
MSASALTLRVRELVQRGRDMTGGGSLRGKVLRNVGWMAIGFGCDVLVRLISSMILTRLLDPGAYGLISTVMVFMVFVGLLSDLGIKTIVTADDRGDDPGFLSTLWTMQVIRGFICAAAVAAFALVWQHALAQHWLAEKSSYANPLLPQLLLLISVSLVLTGFSSLKEFRLVRHLERGAIARMEIGTRIFTAFVTVGLAFLFRSVWAIALGMLLSNVMRTALSHLTLSGPHIGLRFDWTEIKHILKLSRWVALSSTMTVLTTQADKVLIGYGFGLATLGVYAIALTLYTSATTVVDQLNSSLGIPLIRALLEKSEADRLRAYYKFRLPIDLYCAAGGTAMALFGPLFFKIVYDPRYLMGGMYFALFGIKIVLMPMHLFNNFLYAQLRYKLASMIGMIRGVIFLSAMALAVWFRSIHLMVFFIALENLPEIVAFFLLRRTGIPFQMKRDGALLALAAVLAIYLMA